MEWKIIEPDSEYTWLRLDVNGTHDVTLIFTVMGSTRVCLGVKGSMGMSHTWCAGPSILHIWNLLNAMLCAIERNEMHKLPTASAKKPYFNDPDFCQKLEPYACQKDYFHATDLINAYRDWMPHPDFSDNPKSKDDGSTRAQPANIG